MCVGGGGVLFAGLGEVEGGSGGLMGSADERVLSC